METYLEQKETAKVEKEKQKLERKEKREEKKKLKENTKNMKKEPKMKPKKSAMITTDKCSLCKTVIPREEEYRSVGCECGRWFHLACTDIDMGMENMTQEQIMEEISGLEWFCDFCLS